MNWIHEFQESILAYLNRTLTEDDWVFDGGDSPAVEILEMRETIEGLVGHEETYRCDPRIVLEIRYLTELGELKLAILPNSFTELISELTKVVDPQ